MITKLLAPLAGAAAVAATVGLAVPAHAAVFTMCPDGHEGVVGDHTSCGFAANIRDGYFRWGTHFDAFSPAMGQWYEVNCDPTIRPAYFVGGQVVNSVNCYASTNAEVVVW
jgi:hypothetical protein